MKSKYIALLTVLVAFMFSMCDYVKNPYDIEGPSAETFDSTKRVALLEEWTGHTCIACPAAAADIDTMRSLYGESFVAISIHDNFFAEPCPPHALPGCANGAPGAFADDFRCPTGVSYSTAFPDALTFLPQGMVNRLGYPGNSHVKTRGAWPGIVDSIIQEDACASIHIDHIYNSTSRALDVRVWGTWLQSYTGTINVCVMLTESGMVGWQTNGTQCDSEFVFKHVLRECVNTPGSIAGSPLSTGTTLIGTTYSYSLPSSYTIPVAYDATNCHMVAFIYDVTTQEVLQAWEEDL